MTMTTEGRSGPPVTGLPPRTFVLLGDLPRGHLFHTRPLGDLGAQCRNKLGKEWRDLKRWAIASYCYDQLGESWTATSEFRVQHNLNG